MAQKSPLDVSLQDLINQAENRLKWMETTYPGKVNQMTLNPWTASHNIASEKALIKLLKKYKRNPQIDLFEELNR